MFLPNLGESNVAYIMPFIAAMNPSFIFPAVRGYFDTQEEVVNIFNVLSSTMSGKCKFFFFK